MGPVTGTSSGAQPPVVVVGAGGHARVLLEVLRCLGRQVLFVTDRSVGLYGTRIGGAEVRGPDECIAELPPGEVELVNGVGSVGVPNARREVYLRLRAQGYLFATLVHPSAVVAEGVAVAAGAQLMAGVVVQPGASIGENTIVNTRVAVDHDCRVGAHVHLAPGVVLSGTVTVGDRSHLGTGAVVIQGVRIGMGALVAAGAVVTRHVPDGARVAGVPARAMAER